MTDTDQLAHDLTAALAEECGISHKSALVLWLLRANLDGFREHHEDGSVWAQVYLDNVTTGEMSRHAFAGHLSALEAAGLYKPLDGFFGDVRLD